MSIPLQPTAARRAQSIRHLTAPRRHRAGLGRLLQRCYPPCILIAKTVHLVQLSAAAAIRSEGAVHSHVRRALSAGATADDIRHALIATTSTIGFPNVLAALSWSDDVLEKPDAGVA
ncbi:MAG TPA: carboxymuconolactone decarboxylase family protein [Steroidobacteraceae bacterium]